MTGHENQDINRAKATQLLTDRKQPLKSNIQAM